MAIWKRLRKYRDMDLEEEEQKKMVDAEKGDIFAMIISALVTLWLPVSLILLLFGAVLMLLFGAVSF